MSNFNENLLAGFVVNHLYKVGCANINDAKQLDAYGCIVTGQNTHSLMQILGLGEEIAPLESGEIVLVGPKTMDGEEQVFVYDEQMNRLPFTLLAIHEISFLGKPRKACRLVACNPQELPKHFSKFGIQSYLVELPDGNKHLVAKLTH